MCFCPQSHFHMQSLSWTCQVIKLNFRYNQHLYLPQIANIPSLVKYTKLRYGVKQTQAKLSSFCPQNPSFLRNQTWIFSEKGAYSSHRASFHKQTRETHRLVRVNVITGNLLWRLFIRREFIGNGTELI
jgi:hypothetical protein